MPKNRFDAAFAYQQLGLTPGASELEVRRARIRLVRQYHPDLYHGDLARADRELAQINAAYDDVMDDLRSRGAAMSRLDRVQAEAARRAHEKRRAMAGAKTQKATRASNPKTAAPANAEKTGPKVARNSADLLSLPQRDRLAHRAAVAGFAAAATALKSA